MDEVVEWRCMREALDRVSRCDLVQIFAPQAQAPAGSSGFGDTDTGCRNQPISVMARPDSFLLVSVHGPWLAPAEWVMVWLFAGGGWRPGAVW